VIVLQEWGVVKGNEGHGKEVGMRKGRGCSQRSIAVGKKIRLLLDLLLSILAALLGACRRAILTS
jgi:hypothetical protein